MRADRRRVAGAVAGGLLVVLVVLVAELLQSERRLAGSNAQVRVSGAAVELGGDRRRCQPQDIPPRAHRLRIFAAPKERGGGPLAVTVLADGRTLSRARAGLVVSERPIELRLEPPISQEVGDARLCIANLGDGAVTFAGDRTPPKGPANRLGARLDDDVRADFLRAGEDSWLELAPTVATRFGLKKATFFGSWTIWAVLACICLIWVCTLAFVWRRAAA